MISHYDFIVFLVQVTKYQQASRMHMCRFNYVSILWLLFITGSDCIRTCMLWALCFCWCMSKVVFGAPCPPPKPASTFLSFGTGHLAAIYSTSGIHLATSLGWYAVIAGCLAFCIYAAANFQIVSKRLLFTSLISSVAEVISQPSDYDYSWCNRSFVLLMPCWISLRCLWLDLRWWEHGMSTGCAIHFFHLHCKVRCNCCLLAGSDYTMQQLKQIVRPMMMPTVIAYFNVRSVHRSVVKWSSLWARFCF